MNRFISITKYKGANNFNEIINKAIEYIPDEIDIPLTDLYYQGGISNELSIIKDDYMSIPMDFSLQNYKNPL